MYNGGSSNAANGHESKEEGKFATQYYKYSKTVCSVVSIIVQKDELVEVGE